MGFRPRVSETRVYPLHHSPKNWCGRGELHAHAPEGAAVFKTARSPVPRTAARNWSRRPELHRHGQSRPAGFEAAVFPNFTTPRKNWCGRGELHPYWARARRLLGPPRLLVPPHPQKTGASRGTCALLSVLPRQSVAFYGLDAMACQPKP